MINITETKLRLLMRSIVENINNLLTFKYTWWLTTRVQLFFQLNSIYIEVYIFVLINVNFSIFNYSIIYMVDVHLCLWPILIIGKFDALGRAKTTMKMNWFCRS